MSQIIPRCKICNDIATNHDYLCDECRTKEMKKNGKKIYCDPELQYQIEQIIAGKMSFKDKDYQKILKALWKEYKDMCKEDTRITNSRDKIVDELNSW